MGQGGSQIGRDAEREQLAAVLRDAEAGRPGALLIHGEPGIGKTTLVADVTSGTAATGHLVLWGHCLRFGADSSPYLPIGQLLTQWHRRADPAERARVLTGAEHLATVAPALGTASGPADTSRVVPLVATVLDRIAETAPLVLVIDDVQWADGTSLDLLAYLLAGFAPHQRLALLITYRDTELGEGHRLHGWLADCARLPSVSRLRLERLDLADTEALVVGLRGEASGSSGLAEEIYGKSDGNPYYTELLVRGHDEDLDPAHDGLPATLLGAWHGLTPTARELLQLLAVGGRPVAVDVLEQLVAARGHAPDDVAPSLAEAVGTGLTTTTPDGDIWFHHPLVAEVVATTLTPAARRLVHKQYVEVVQLSSDLTPASRAAHLALHHAGSGDPDRAFVWSLRAADEAGTVRGYAEVLEHLHRACRLWDDVDDGARASAGDRVDLWQRASESAWSAGEHLLAVHLREEAIAREGPDDDPVRAVRLRLPLLDWRVECGLDARHTVEPTRRLVELAESHCPETPEHAHALARLAHVEVWNDDEEAASRHAVAAVEMARRTGSAEALAWALSMRSETPPWDHHLEHATRALALAREVGEPWLLGWAATRAANRLDMLGRLADVADVLLTTFRQLVASGSVHDAMSAAPARGALALLDTGQWDEAREVARLLLSHRLSTSTGAATRGVAALLALRTGDLAAGRAHLSRARELTPRTSRAGDLLAGVEIEAEGYHLGHPRKALSFAAQLMPDTVTIDPRGSDELLVIAAQAACEIAEEPGGRDEAVALLDRIEGLRGQEPPPFELRAPEDTVHPARQALFAAQRARCHGDVDTTTLWREATSRCSTAGLLWHEALSSYHLGYALLAEHHSRTEAASALRHAARIASDLGAAPILRSCEELSRQAHIPLGEPAADEALSAADGVLGSLTPREREVLSHLVAGRTYAEIARALFISEKTVSVHVSNLLRKTGTRGRVELADLVRRTSATR